MIHLDFKTYLHLCRVKVYKSFNEFIPVKNAVVTIGTFDGVHIGHQKIINRIKEIAEEEGGETVIITFYPHPRAVLHPEDNNLKLINSLEEKIALLEKYGIGHLIIQPFTKEFSQLSAAAFVKEVLVNKLGTKILVIGYNHQFGRNREGSLEQLMELAPVYDFKVEEIPKQDIDYIAVSSTKIRNAILEGDIETANLYSGNPFTLTGIVEQGNQMGRTIGFPTANIGVSDPNKIIPGNGVYAVIVEWNKEQYKGMLNIGMRPTLGGLSRTIEVYILDFDQSIYGQGLTLVFKSRIRDEKKFDGIEALREQLLIDKKNAIKLLS